MFFHLFRKDSDDFLDDVFCRNRNPQAVFEIVRLIRADGNVGIAQGLVHGRSVGNANEDEVGRTGIGRNFRHVLQCFVENVAGRQRRRDIMSQNVIGVF